MQIPDRLDRFLAALLRYIIQSANLLIGNTSNSQFSLFDVEASMGNVTAGTVWAGIIFSPLIIWIIHFVDNSESPVLGYR